MKPENKKAIILLSGGIDSTTMLVYAIENGYQCYALSFDYSQKNKIELDYARRNALKYKVKEFKIIKLKIKDITTSSLITNEIEIKKYNSINELPKSTADTYVPARNTIFLSYALAWAETLKIPNIFIGVNKDDFIGFPDTRNNFFRKFEELANLTSKEIINSKVNIITPFINMTKAEIIKYGINHGIDYNETISCYSPIDGKPCGQCYACIIRKNAFEKINSR